MNGNPCFALISYLFTTTVVVTTDNLLILLMFICLLLLLPGSDEKESLIQQGNSNSEENVDKADSSDDKDEILSMESVAEHIFGEKVGIAVGIFIQMLLLSVTSILLAILGFFCKDVVVDFLKMAAKNDAEKDVIKAKYEHKNGVFCIGVALFMVFFNQLRNLGFLAKVRVIHSGYY